VSPIRAPRRLVAVWLLLAVLAVVIVTIEYVDRRATSGSAQPDASALLRAAVDELGAVEIADRGRLHRFERDDSGAWFYHGIHTEATAAHTHTPDPALAERIARTFAAFGRARIERQFPLDRNADVYGVATPEIVVLAYRRGQSQPLTQYAVGHVAPDTVSRYVMVVGSPAVVTIPKYQIDNLLDLVRVAGGEAASR
jgi:GAF domain-containing protein